MKKKLLLTTALFAFFSALSAQITQGRADEIVWERMSQETRPYLIWGKENVQTEMTITTSTGEELELDYSCWVYYVSDMSANCCIGRYLIVNESNGNLLEINAKSNAAPKNLEEWRIVTGTSNKLRGIWMNKESFALQYIDFYSNDTAKFVNRVRNTEINSIFCYKLLDDNEMSIRFVSNTSETIHKLTFVDDETIKISNLTSIPENPDISYYRCEQLTIGQTDTITLAYRHIYYDTEKDFRLQIDSVCNDSRCPMNPAAVCVWAGDVEVHFDLIYSGNYRKKFTLNINNKFQTDTIINNIHFRLLSVDPYPEDGKTITQKDYKVKILVNPFTPIAIAPVSIGQGSLYGAGSEGITKQNLVITDQTAWDNLVTAMNSVNNESRNFTETTIDFSKYQVLAVFDHVKGSGGWSIDMTDVTEYRDEIVVTVENLQKGDATRLITQPYHIVKMPVSDKKIVFKEVEKEIQYVFENYYADAKQLYFDEIIKDTNHPNYNDPELDKSEIEKILKIIQAVYDSRSLERDTVFDIYQIHGYYCYSFNSISLIVNAEFSSIQNLSQGIIPTGDEALDKILAVYAFDSVSTSYGYPQFPWLMIYTKKEYNMIPVEKEFNQLESILIAEHNSGCVGDGNTIQLIREEDSATITFSIGRGDCPAGCIYHRHWEFKVSGGVAKFIKAYQGNYIYKY